MAGSVNKVMLLGNLGAKPEIRTFPSGGRVANFSVATSRKWKDRTSGEMQERTEWHRISVSVEFMVTLCEKYLDKGSGVFISGRLETRKWQDKSGQDRYMTEVVIPPYEGELVMLPRSSGGGGGGRDGGQGGGQGGGGRDGGGGGQGGGGGGRDGGGGQGGGQPFSGDTGGGDMDDDIPF